jgi:hypothetical protein
VLAGEDGAGGEQVRSRCSAAGLLVTCEIVPRRDGTELMSDERPLVPPRDPSETLDALAPYASTGGYNQYT